MSIHSIPGIRSGRLLLLAILLGLPLQTAAAPLKIGVAAVDVSPQEFPINMPGGFGPNMAESSNDPLHSRAFVLSDGETTIALVLVDNLGVAQPVVDEAKLLASRKTPILPEHILISATHTHSAPASNVIDGPAPAVSYRKRLLGGIVDSIVQAHSKLRPAGIASASHALPDEVFNRRWFLKPGKMPLNPFGGTDLVKMNPPISPDVLLHPAGTTDPEVAVLSMVELPSKRPLGIYANYALHYVGGTPSKKVSADYFGEFARLMPARLNAPSDFVAALTNGASGNINNIPFNSPMPRPPREPMEQIRIVAGKTADAVWHARQKISVYHSDVKLGMLTRPITLKYRKPDPEMLKRAETIASTTDAEAKKQYPPLADSYANRTIDLAKRPATVTLPLQAIAIGQTAIVAIPFETFVEIGLDIKKRSPFAHTIVVGIANGYNGYLPPPEQHRLGGYETWLGTNNVQEDTSVLITEQLLSMLGDLSARQARSLPGSK
ncbi:neutral/alkaline non-lysosomal ceramidase N-terminal domain-containing protein [Tuwongella immobilis]|uniref:Neutral/alkaline non-lysosomal ceramidase N-terminal domain-containing protein n=1 Tax=Tuwongella immobilis TaxID=692036 RepID=A0A6C2YMU4_9BACT|nr:neutral/alkaline non-lysosomal ceramidase N-terminal domain-containing protein [Tuwongella immobilis]VIP02918.1 Uncharacterized protein OS=Chthoniobacter flavus Ellin428 GN=CfE428DRAFT_6315 PE=4 SV=1: Ceramidase_alk [Tuwongella immobilis]VTS02842.1 Uncharacterized protein OS=Chthoniobacter flavus Ellin428 GN=CfE428DRAFT_6315 PE=4 SV=1: Ceramidase_alk [Tuwongella immobilis]